MGPSKDLERKKNLPNFAFGEKNCRNSLEVVEEGKIQAIVNFSAASH